MKPITIEGCACVVGRFCESRHSTWIVREPITGLAVSNPEPTRKEAIAGAVKKIKMMGGAETFKQAIENHQYQEAIPAC